MTNAAQDNNQFASQIPELFASQIPEFIVKGGTRHVIALRLMERGALQEIVLPPTFKIVSLEFGPHGGGSDAHFDEAAVAALAWRGRVVDTCDDVRFRVQETSGNSQRFGGYLVLSREPFEHEVPVPPAHLSGGLADVRAPMVARGPAAASQDPPTEPQIPAAAPAHPYNQFFPGYGGQHVAGSTSPEAGVQQRPWRAPVSDDWFDVKMTQGEIATLYRWAISNPGPEANLCREIIERMQLG